MDELTELWAQATQDPARTELCHVNKSEQGNLQAVAASTGATISLTLNQGANYRP